MTAFRTPLDIANRAMQHVGARRITSMTQDDRSASEVNACYDQLREAELRRNVWRFAIRKAVLRPISATTKLLVPTAYVGATAYAYGAIVSSGGQVWQAQAATTGETPGTGTAWDLYFGSQTVELHDATMTYWAGDLVYVGAALYLSLVGDNSTTPPGASWLTLTGTTATAFSILYPIGSGPSTQQSTRNVYRLPYNYLREAPQNPKAGVGSWYPAGSAYDDWEFEGDYIVTSETGPIVFRFVVNSTVVARFDPMFCEGLAARIGIEVCEALTQSTSKLANIGTAYQKFMGEARIVNGIETGAAEPPEDDFITCRL